MVCGLVRARNQRHIQQTLLAMWFCYLALVFAIVVTVDNICCVDAAAASEQDQALCTFISVTNVKSVLANWACSSNTATNPCSWTGISCDGTNSKVVAINISARSISGTLPSEFFQLTSLTKLDLSSTLISGRLPTVLGKLLSLSYLNLYNDFMTGSLPSTFSQLSSLVYVNLYYNMFSGTLPSLSSLAKLSYLDLAMNGFTGTLSSSLCSSTGLTFLSTNGNSFNCFPNCFSTMSALQHSVTYCSSGMHQYLLTLNLLCIR